MHIHDWSRWEDVGSVATDFYHGGAIIQTCHCNKCGKRKIRKTNSVSSIELSSVARLLSILIKGKENERE